MHLYYFENLERENQTFVANNYRNKISKDGKNLKRRLCHEHDEIIKHITSESPALAKREYLANHEKATI